MITCTKLYADIPFAHRQHNHDGHCRFIHGHNWSFEFTFAANATDGNGFVLDFGKLKWLKEWINATFDHKLVLNNFDPYRERLTEMTTNLGLAEITVVPDASCEGLARWLYHEVTAMLKQFGELSARNVRIDYVRVMEDSKNYATYTP